MSRTTDSTAARIRGKFVRGRTRNCFSLPTSCGEGRFAEAKGKTPRASFDKFRMVSENGTISSVELQPVSIERSTE